MTILNDGKVGIGTDAPGSKLTVDQSGGAGAVTALSLIHSRTGTPANGDAVSIDMRGDFWTGSAANERVMARITATVEDVTNGAPKGKLDFATLDTTGAITDKVTILSDGKVGIGSTDPGYLLDVNGTANIGGALTGAAATFTGSARFDGNVIVDTATGSNPLWVTRLGATNEAMSIKVEDRMVEFELNQDETTGDHLFLFNIVSSTSGNKYYQFNNGRVGIKKTPSTSYNLDVTGAVNFDGALTIGAYTLPNTDGTVGYHLQTDGAGTVTWAAGGAGTVTGTGTANYISKWTNTSVQGNSQIFDDGTSVGIGEGAPSSLLSIGGNSTTTLKPTVAIVDTTAGAMLQLRGQAPTIFMDSTSSGIPTILTDGKGIEIKDGTLDAQGTVDFVIDANGDVGIGTDNPAYRLDTYDTVANIAIFRSTITSYARVIIRSGATGDAQLCFQNDTSSKWTIGNDGGDSDKFKIATGGGAFAASEAVVVDTSGNMNITGVYTEASSLAIKENIETYSPSLEMINRMRPVKYNKKRGGKKEIGLIAEELVEMFPELVEMDKDGKPSGVNYTRAVAVLLHGFKELYKEVKELKEKI